MKIVNTLILVVILKIVSISGGPEEWHADVSWLPLPTALERSKEEGKPIMLVIHKSWCGACKALKPKFHDSKEIGELSKKFLMVNTGDDDEPSDGMYRPDGGYIPRILFIKDGEVVADLYNEKGNAKYKFYYNRAEQVVNTMQAAVEMFGQGTQQLKEDL